jgi:hypothetical protein
MRPEFMRISPIVGRWGIRCRVIAGESEEGATAGRRRLGFRVGGR